MNAPNKKIVRLLRLDFVGFIIFILGAVYVLLEIFLFNSKSGIGHLLMGLGIGIAIGLNGNE